MQNITLITNKICPYARKANIAMRQKNPSFQVVEENLQNKSQFFKQSYAKALGKNLGKDGLVPIIIDQGTYLAESEPIVWYIAQKYPDQGYNLIPENHVQRFKMRIFIEQFSKKITVYQNKYFGWGNKKDDQRQKHNQQTNQFFEKLNKSLALPYALGQQFTVADVLIYPHLELWPALQYFTGSGINKNYEKIHQYINEVQKRKSVKDLIESKEAYVEALKKFF